MHYKMDNEIKKQLEDALGISIGNAGNAAAITGSIRQVLQKPDGVYLTTFLAESIIRVHDGKLEIHAHAKDEEPLRNLCGLLIAVAGWDDQAISVANSKLISYKGPLQLDREPAQKPSMSFRPDAAFTQDQKRRDEEEKTKREQQAKDAFDRLSQTLKDRLEARVQIWQDRGVADVKIVGEKVVVKVSDAVTIEDSLEKLDYFGEFDRDAIKLIFRQAKEEWGGKFHCNSDDEEFKQQVWKAAQIYGVKFSNYTPPKAVKQRLLEEIRQERAAAQPAPKNSSPAPAAAVA